MYDMSKVRRRYYDLKLLNGKVLNIEPPKLKVLKKISALSKIKDDNNITDDELNNLSEALSIALSKNKQNYKISVEQVEDWFNIDEILDLLTDYFEWINSEQKN